MLAIDVSNYQAGIVTRERVRCWRDQHNVELAIVRGSLERQPMVDIAYRQIDAFLNEGVPIAIYPWAYFSADDPVGHANTIVDVYGHYSPLFYAIDCEELEHVLTPAGNITWLSGWLGAADERHIRSVVYTGKWWWNDPRYMAGTHAFKDRPLWVADYRPLNDNPLDNWARFGGWEHAVGVQWAGDSSPHGYAMCDYRVDQNYFDRDWVFGTQEENLGQIEDLTSRLGYATGDVASAIESAIIDARNEQDRQKQSEYLDAAQAAVNTLRTLAPGISAQRLRGGN